MRTTLASLALGCLAATTVSVARADRVYLTGGTVLDGDVARKGGKVVIEGESGTIAVPADSVVKIEKAESALARFEADYAVLRPGDVKARMALADFCRSKDMKQSERRMLLEVVAIEPEHAGARARLGYVKGEGGWVTEAEAMRARGLVMYEGQWMSEATVRELERARAQVADASRQQEEAELSARRAALAADQAAYEAERSRYSDGWRSSSIYFTPIYRTYGSYPRAYGAYAPRGAGFDGECYGYDCRRSRGGARAPAHPGPDTSMSVVKVPYRNP
jgi:hypothetical protein